MKELTGKKCKYLGKLSKIWKMEVNERKIDKDINM